MGNSNQLRLIHNYMTSLILNSLCLFDLDLSLATAIKPPMGAGSPGGGGRIPQTKTHDGLEGEGGLGALGGAGGRGGGGGCKLQVLLR